MQFRRIASLMALVMATYGLPSALAQDTQGQTSPAGTAQSDENSLSSVPPTEQNAPQPVQQPDDSKVKHDGSKNDVDAIGNRKIGGRGVGNWYSIEGEIRLGKEYAQQVEASVKLVQDPVVNEYVNRIGQNLVRNSDAQVPFTIKVIDSDEVNAFALPGGFFYVNAGLILATDEEAELAGVMAHEIAHVAARHATRQATRANWANIGTIPLIFVGGGIGYAVRSAAGLALPLTFLTFSRGFEAEADYLGLQYMYKTGYDPNAFISFFEKIQAQEKQKPGNAGQSLLDSPADSRPHCQVSGGDCQDPARPGTVRSDDFRIRRREGTAGFAGKPAQGRQPERNQQTQLAADLGSRQERPGHQE